MRIFPEIITLQYNISQALGFLALIFVCIGYFCKKERLIVYQIIANLIIMLSLVFLGETFGWVSTLIATIRFVVFYILQKQNKEVPIWFLCLITYSFVASCLLLGGANYELLQMIALINFTFAFLLNDEVRLRIIILVSCVFFMAYNIILFNFFGVIRSIVEFLIVFISLLVFLRKKKYE